MFKNWMDYFTYRYDLDEKGQGLVEYALIIALIAVLLVASLTGVKNAIVNTFNNITGKL